MATSDPIQPVSTADVRATLDQIENLIRDWRSWLPADDVEPEPGVAREAARVAGIAEATVTQAACDTRAISERATGSAVSGPCLRVVHRP